MPFQNLYRESKARIGKDDCKVWSQLYLHNLLIKILKNDFPQQELYQLLRPIRRKKQTSTAVPIRANAGFNFLVDAPIMAGIDVQHV